MSDFVILNGFDRSGSSAISRVISSHPDVELIMQPFNSGFLRRKLYEIIKEEDTNSDTNIFFRDLTLNKLNLEHIKSEWFYKFSTVTKYQPGKLHIIKTTINHFAQKWMKKKYPQIDVWGIWREPTEIISSIMRNGFYGKWYAQGIREILPAVKEEVLLSENYLKYFPLIRNEIQGLALLIAIRTHFFLEYLDEDKLLFYETFKDDADIALKYFSEKYQLSKHNYNIYSHTDLNIIGKQYHPSSEINFSIAESEKDLLNEIFAPLYSLLCQKFSYDKIS